MQPEQLLNELESELADVLATMASLRPATEDVSVSNDAGNVEVVVSPQRQILKISVAPNWSEKLEPEALAASVAETISRAQSKALGFDLDALEAGQVDRAEVDPAEVRRMRDQLMAEKTEELLRPMSEDELRRQVDELPGMLEALDRLADDVAARIEAVELPQEIPDALTEESLGTVIHSQNRMVSVRVMAGFVGEVTIRKSWLANRSGIAVTECFDQIIEQLPDVVADQKLNPGAGA